MQLIKTVSIVYSMYKFILSTVLVIAVTNIHFRSCFMSETSPSHCNLICYFTDCLLQPLSIKPLSYLHLIHLLLGFLSVYIQIVRLPRYPLFSQSISLQHDCLITSKLIFRPMFLQFPPLRIPISIPQRVL